MSISRQTRWLPVVLGGLMLATPALAADDSCPEYPQAQWLTKDQVTAKAKELGYEVRSLSREGSCWEMKGFDKAGERVEVAFNPVTAEVVRVEK